MPIDWKVQLEGFYGEWLKILIEQEIQETFLSFGLNVIRRIICRSIIGNYGKIIYASLGET
jgi:hypothetical protein